MSQELKKSLLDMVDIGVPTLKLPKFTPPKIDAPNPAKWTYERLTKQIIEFENDLTPEEEIGGRLVAAPGGVFHIEDVGYWGPDMLIFHGSDQAGRPIQVLQHLHLCALPKADEEAEAKRIGFVLAERLEED